MSIIFIDGVALPPPSSLSVAMQDLDGDGTTRNEAGFLQRDMIREGVYKIELEFQNKTGVEVTKIQNAIAKASMRVTFPDSGGNVTKTMYVGDRTKDSTLFNKGVPSKARWTLKFNMIEY